MQKNCVKNRITLIIFNSSGSNNFASINDEDSEAAAQSLLMLGMGEPWMVSSSSGAHNKRSFSVSGQQDQEVPNNTTCYYQKMREKNNAAR